MSLEAIMETYEIEEHEGMDVANIYILGEYLHTESDE